MKLTGAIADMRTRLRITLNTIVAKCQIPNPFKAVLINTSETRRKSGQRLCLATSKVRNKDAREIKNMNRYNECNLFCGLVYPFLQVF